ncbi:MAG TPA: dihydropteroate synthase, partial [Gammaproteobacteria bacterium]|nr:dihydropteroate synthase [Gammaproteobacteria bacterium]
DGGAYRDLSKALFRCEQMIEEGANIIDIGGESTRPKASPVSSAVELERVLPVIEAIRSRMDIVLSVDTRHFEVMEACLKLGVEWINDISALQEPNALHCVAHFKPYIVLMHMQGLPSTMQDNPTYCEIIQDVKSFFTQRIQVCIEAGIPSEKIVLDPGFGFGKNLQHNLTLLNRLDELNQTFPLLIGLSRKSMFYHLLGRAKEDRLPASLAATVIAVLKGANIIRTHDVKATADCVAVVSALKKLR